MFVGMTMLQQTPSGNSTYLYFFICIVISFTVTCQHGYFGEQQDLVYPRNNCNKTGSFVQNAVDK